MRRKFFCLLMGMSILLTGCKNQPIAENTQTPLYSVKADLSHTGEKWNIKTYFQKRTTDTPETYQVKVYDKNNHEIWKSEQITSQDEWSYYLVCKTDGAYLLSYQPLTESDGKCNFSYRAFYVDPEGIEIVADKERVEFDSFPREDGEEPRFPEEKMIAFANCLNDYLDDAVILVNTTDEGRPYSTQKNLATFHEDYRDVLAGMHLDGTGDLAENVSRLHERLLSGN